MARQSKQTTVRFIIDHYGQTFADELGIGLERNTPSPLFRLLCFSLLASTRIGHNIAVRAARALAREGWTTPERMAASTWRKRTNVLNASGYARYDEGTATRLEQTTSLLLDRYQGDLRRLRDAADRDPRAERDLLKEFKGIGDVGVDIFFREVQLPWEELFPFADQRILKAARRMGLGKDAAELRRLVRGKRDYIRLVAGIVRIELEDRYAELPAAA